MRALAKGTFKPISNRSLALALVSVTQDLYPHLCYLADKGYITITAVDDEDIHGMESVINLTAKGVDLIEESIPADPGITL
jgi:DNA-binding PadR family transcriptional regulator